MTPARIAAIAAVAKLKAPEKDEGAKKKKDWLEWADSMHKDAAALAAAIKTKDTSAVKNAAVKLNTTYW